MAGWRARHDEHGEPLEIVDDGEPSEVEVAGGRTVDWHRITRTGASVVAALSLLWMAASWADERSDAATQSCVSDVHQAYSRYEQLAYTDGHVPGEPLVEPAIARDLAQRIRSCGGEAAQLHADAMLYERPDRDRD